MCNKISTLSYITCVHLVHITLLEVICPVLKAGVLFNKDFIFFIPCIKGIGDKNKAKQNDIFIVDKQTITSV